MSGMTTARPHRLAMLVLGLLVLVPNLIGLPYFLLPFAKRVRHPLHVWFKSSGYVGQAAGIATLLLFLFMYVYPMRKRFRFLASLGRQERWLAVHIAAGLVIPFIGAMHAGWRFKGLIGLGYIAMLMVSVSGVAGRYIYTRIPRAGSGRELTEGEVIEREQRLEQEISTITGLQLQQVRDAFTDRPVVGKSGAFSALIKMFTYDIDRRRTVRKLAAQWTSSVRLDSEKRRRLNTLLRDRIALGQQHSMLEVTRRLFGYWHVIHRPFSITSFAAVVVHVVVVVSLGVTWF